MLMPKDRPTLFQPAMIDALWHDRKTQTRRLAKIPFEIADWQYVQVYDKADLMGNTICCRVGADYPDSIDDQFTIPYKVGDLLWVRERGAISRDRTAFEPFHGNEINHKKGVAGEFWPKSPDGTPYKNCVSIHMPRWASRMTLKIVKLRVQRLNKITIADAIEEGIMQLRPSDNHGQHWGVRGIDEIDEQTPTMAYRALWEFINGPSSWTVNPWVVAISFDVFKQNIDTI